MSADSVPPVILREPKRAAAAPVGVEVDPFWGDYLAKEEMIHWQGVSTPILAVTLTRALTAGWGALLRTALDGLFGAAATSRDKFPRYALTNRAAYIATQTRDGAVVVASYPITPKMRLGLGARSVTFASQTFPDGQEEPVGFLDIPGSSDVYAMIKDIQKGQP